MKAFIDQTGTAEPNTYAQYLYSGGQRVKKLVRNSSGSTETTVYIDGVFEHRYNSNADAQSVVHVGSIATVRTDHSFDRMPISVRSQNNSFNVNFELKTKTPDSEYRAFCQNDKRNLEAVDRLIKVSTLPGNCPVTRFASYIKARSITNA